MPYAFRLAAALALAVSLPGCGLPRALGIAPYKIEVQQGNYLSQDMLAQVKTGMSKEQVRQIMGTPLLVDIFHGERWDYVYTRDNIEGKPEKHRIALFFEDGKLARMDGDPATLPRSPAAGR
jgi:outer membrane protein assembly factor BamE